MFGSPASAEVRHRGGRDSPAEFRPSFRFPTSAGLLTCLVLVNGVLF